MKASESLDDAGVVDGALLTLVSVSRTERYRPLVEDVIDAIAVLDESPEFDRSGAESLCRRWPFRWRRWRSPRCRWCRGRRTGHSWWWAVALGVLGLGLLGGSMLAKNRYHNIDMAESLLVASLPVLGRRGGVGGSAAAGCRYAWGAAGRGRRRGGAAAGVGDARRAAQARGARVVPGDHGDGGDRGGRRVRLRVAVLGARRGAIAFGLIVVTNAAKLTVAVARIALPPIPAPGRDGAATTNCSTPSRHPDASDEESRDVAGDHRLGAGLGGTAD